MAFWGHFGEHLPNISPLQNPKKKFQKFSQTQGKHYCFIRSGCDCGAHWFAKSCFFGLPCCPQGVPRGCPRGAQRGPGTAKRPKQKKQNTSKTLWWSMEVVEVVRPRLTTSTSSKNAWVQGGPPKNAKNEIAFFCIAGAYTSKTILSKARFRAELGFRPFPFPRLGHTRAKKKKKIVLKCIGAAIQNTLIFFFAWACVQKWPQIWA